MKAFNYLERVSVSFLLFFNLYLCILISRVLSFILSFIKFNKKKDVLFLENFPFENAGYQYRAYKWSEILKDNGYDCTVVTIINSRQQLWSIQEQSSNTYFLIYALWKRMFQVGTSVKYRTVVVRRELLLFNDYGNLFMEKFLLKIHPLAILDFDDDISAAKNQPKAINNLFGRILLEDGNKFNNSIRLYKRFIVASNYLMEKILNENPNIDASRNLVMPTCVDYNRFTPRQYLNNSSEVITLGWIGGDHNYNLLDSILDSLNELTQNHNVRLLVIGGSPYVRDAKIKIDFEPWSLESEIDSLLKVDVGLMPLPDSLRARGKGGFKLIQYMGLGIVSVASCITINKEIVEDGVNGFLVEPKGDWHEILVKVLKRKSEFATIGVAARSTIMNRYTFSANYTKYKSFLFGE